MALINCPECGKEVSDRAPACIHCGFPFSELKKEEPALANDNPSEELNPSLRYRVVLRKVGANAQLIREALSSINVSYDDAILDLPYILKRNVDVTEAKQLEELMQEARCTVSIESMDTTFEKGQTPVPKTYAMPTRVYYGYKCPSCGTTAGKEMSKLGKTVSVGLWGVASNKLGKTYKCEKCGYMW